MKWIAIKKLHSVAVLVVAACGLKKTLVRESIKIVAMRHLQLVQAKLQ